MSGTEIHLQGEMGNCRAKRIKLWHVMMVYLLPSTPPRHQTMTFPIVTAGLTAAVVATAAAAAAQPEWAAKTGASPYAVDLFTTSLDWNDAYWNDEARYLISPPGAMPGRYDSRHTGWYATQLLARNGPGDVQRAIQVFDNVISAQYLDPDDQWYGDYQQSPSEPLPGPEYPSQGPYSSVT